MASIGVLQVQVQPDMAGFQSQVTGAMRNVASAARAVGGQVTRDLGRVGATIAATSGLAVAGLALIGVKTAASLETATLQFQTLLGSADEARAKVAELFQFAKVTPFESGPVIEASRRLQVFGGDALNTAENLQRIGDAAAATSAPIEEVAFWVGRAYSQIRGGQPFGEAAMRLQELGVLTPEVRTEMENLAAAGADSTEVFAQLQGQLDQFAGAMELQAATLSGLASTIKDQFNIGLATAFQPLFDQIKNIMGVLRDFGDTPVFDRIMQDAARLLTVLLSGVTPAISGLADALGSLTTGEVDSFFAGLADRMVEMVSFAGDLKDVLQPLAPIIIGIGAAIASSFLGGIPVIGLFVQAISPITGALLGLALGFEENRAALGSFLGDIGSAFQQSLPGMQSAIQRISDALGTAFRGSLEALRPAIEVIVSDLIPALVNVMGEVAPELADVVTQMADIASTIITAVVPALTDLIEFLGDIQVGQLEVVGGILEQIGIAADSASDALKGDFRGVNAELQEPIGSLNGMAEVLGSIAPGGLLGINAALSDTAEESDNADQRVRSLAQSILMMGDNGDTAAAWVDRLGRATPELDRMLTALSEGGVRMGELGDALAGTDEKWSSFLDSIGATGIMREVLQGLRDDYQAGADAAGELADETENTKNKNDEAAAATSTYADSLRNLRDAMDEAMNKQLGLQEAEVRFRDGLAGLSTALADVNAKSGLVGGTWDLTSEAGRRGAEAVQEQVENLNNFVNSLAGSNLSLEQMQQKSTEAYNSLVSGLAAGLSISTAAAADLLAQLGLTPETIQTKMEVATQEAETRLAALQTRLAAIDDPSFVAHITALAEMGQLDQAEAELDAYDQRSETADVRAADHATPTIRGAEGRLNSWGASSGTADVNAQDNASSVIARVREALFGSNGLDGRTATVTVATVRRPTGSPGLVPGAGGGVGLMMTSEDAGLLRATATSDAMVLAGRTLGRPSDLPAGLSNAVLAVPVIENRTYLGQTEVTDVVKSETVVIERDRSMKYLTGVR